MGKRQVPFDRFATPIKGFNLEGQVVSKSWLGFVCTLILFCIVIGVLTTQLISLFARENVSVSVVEESVPTPLPTSLKSLMMAFGVMRREAPLISLTPEVDFTIDARLVTITFFGLNPRQLETHYDNVTMERCDRSYFGDRIEEIEKLINPNDVYCIPRDVDESLMTIEGQIGSETFKFLEVRVQCTTSSTPTTPGEPTPCTSFVTSNILFMYGASFMNVSNYDNPIKITPTAMHDRADRNAYHEKPIFITPREIITDHGVTFSDMGSQLDLIVSEGQSIIEGINVLSPTVFSFQIRMSANKFVIRRTYKTILDVLASVTGIASAVTLVVGFLLRPYAEQITHHRIMRYFSPSKHKAITFADVIKALFGNKKAKAKLARMRKDKDWITKNMDIIMMLRNWTDLKKIRTSILNIDPAVSLSLENKSSDPKCFEKGRKSILNDPTSSIVDVKSTEIKSVDKEIIISDNEMESNQLTPQEQP